MKKKLPPNPYSKKIRIQARLNNEEMQIVMSKALLYFNGSISELVRDATLNYKGKKAAK